MVDGGKVKQYTTHSIFSSFFLFIIFYSCLTTGTAVESGETGWFPSNYVSEYKAPAPPTEVRAPEEIQAFRSVVYKDLLESERAHCAELRGLLENFLEPLETSQM
jgi:hypothetical protein